MRHTKTAGHDTTAAGRSRTILTTILIAGLAAALAFAAGGCAASNSKPAMSGVGGGMKTTAPAGGAMKAMNMPASSAESTGLMMCAGCNGKKIPVVAGATTVQGSVQTVQIDVVDGYYAPNKITAKAGIPIKVVFSGKVKGCVGMPKFGSLGKQVDFTSGTATLDLGTLKAGTYEFTCKMGSNTSSFIVQ
jgi:hypothetical protein